MKTKLTKQLRKRRGQGMTEYLIITALIAVGAIGVVGILGKNVQANFGTIANALRGGDSIKVQTADQVTDADQWDMGDFYKGAKTDANGGN
jgi:Flp pilus assembly pilin Flp